MYRTHNCNQITKLNIGEVVKISGWVNTARDHGGVIFIDIRDRYGIIQIKADPDTTDKNLIEIAKNCKSEFVIQVEGIVSERPEGTINKELNTGEIEIIPSNIIILSEADHPPFEVADEHFVREEIRMTYRYIDLRRKSMQKNIIARHNLLNFINDYLRENDFLFIETPYLIKNTPEGSREYVVPSRNSQGKFYVLPQSPQQLKQILMVAGFDKYYQIARCFRDEDLRGDRQPEFTQIDIELSFVEQDDITSMIEDVFIKISKKLYPNRKILSEPFEVLKYDDALNTYGIDKPELRTKELKLIDVSEIAKKSELKVFKEIVDSGGVVKGIVVDKVFTRGVIDKLTSKLQEKGAKGLAYIIWDEEGPKSPILKFFSQELQNELFNKIGAKKGTTSFFQATNWLQANELLGYLRNILIEEMQLISGKENELAYAWVIDFPMFEFEEDGNFAAKHHPFTKPKNEYIPLIKELANKKRKNGKLDENDFKQLINVKADAYDLVLNGNEVAGGSIRINDKELQKDIFTLLGLNQEIIEERFGHLIKAFNYGVPPHGGIAIGFDRLLMCLQNSSSIREVIAFPKSQKGDDLMLKCPSYIEPKLLKELGLQLLDI